MVVVFHPPFAERELQDEERHSGQQACRDAQIVVQGKAPVVIKHSSGHALGDVVRQAHPAIRDDFAHERLHPGTVKAISPPETNTSMKANLYKELTTRLSGVSTDGLLMKSGNMLPSPYSGKKCNQGSAKYLVPHFQVFFQEQAPSADEQSEEE